MEYSDRNCVGVVANLCKFPVFVLQEKTTLVTETL